MSETNARIVEGGSCEMKTSNVIPIMSSGNGAPWNFTTAGGWGVLHIL